MFVLVLVVAESSIMGITVPELNGGYNRVENWTTRNKRGLERKLDPAGCQNLFRCGEVPSLTGAIHIRLEIKKGECKSSHDEKINKVTRSFENVTTGIEQTR